MRIIVIDEKTDLQGLRARLVGERQLPEAALEKLKDLNPHVDFKRIPEGTVLLLPELPELRKGATTSVAGEPFEAFREGLQASLEAAAVRVRMGYRALQEEEKEVTSALRSAAFRRALEVDPALREQAEAGAQAFKEDREAAKEADETLKALRKEASAELAALSKHLG